MKPAALVNISILDCIAATEQRWFKLTATPLQGMAQGGAVIAHTDITRQKEFELAQQETLLRLKKITERAPGMVYQFRLRPDGSSCFPFASDAIRDIYRGSPEQACEDSAPVLAALHPDDNDSYTASILQSARNLSLWQHEFRVRFDDDTVHWLLGNAIPEREADGSVLWTGFLTDISERKLREQQLLDSELLMRTAIETIGEAFVIYDPDDRLVFCNLEYLELYQLSAPVLQPGRTFEEIVRYGVEHGQYLDAVGREEEWMQDRLQSHRRGNQELIQKLEDGRWLKIRERTTPSGHIIGFRLDITEFHAAVEAAEAASVAKSRFLANMSHDIRTPMNAIIGMSQVLMLPDVTELERIDYARTIVNSSNALLDLLNDILDVAKIEAGKVGFESIALEPKQLVQETERLFSENARSKGLQLQSHWRTTPHSYLGDHNRVLQMLSNLVSNAVKFTSQGSIMVEAREVEHQNGSATLEFSVTDSGCGIAADKQALLFQQFSQTDNSITRDYGGSGLGLSIVSGLAHAMGGAVGVQSEAGHGARFWFRIPAPICSSTPGVAQIAAPDANAAIASNSLTQFCNHILLVEDNLTNQKVLTALLNRLGVTVALVVNGQQALDAIKAGQSADLILMDLQMPVMNGYLAAQEIRAWEARNAQPRRTIIALTANAFEEDRQRCLNVGMDDFLPKPVLIDTLRTMLIRWLPSTIKSQIATENRRPIDAARVSALLREIEPLLRQKKFNALSRFRDLREATAGTEMAQEVAQIGPLLENFRFELALEHVRRLQQHTGAKNPCCIA